MATTAAGTPYVESSDLVANYPGVSLALANHIDTIGKVLQVVRATDSTNRSTTSTVFVDASISVVVTPQKSNSNILIIYTMGADCVGSNGANALNTTAITDSSNNLLSSSDVGWANFTTGSTGYIRVQQTVFAYNAPGTLSAVTYKGRFKSGVGFSFTSQNSLSPAQMFAIEVAA
jgi:hypothetical protein